MTNSYFTIEADIVRTCGYIKDDKYIASVYGVSLSKVRRLREKVPLYKRDHHNSNDKIDNIDISNHQFSKMMENGSKQLADAILNFLKERERKMRYAPKS